MSNQGLALVSADEPTPVTKDDLERLLTIRVEAHQRFSAAHQAVSRYTSTDPVDDARIEADIEKAVALKASCAADDAYDACIQRYVAQQKATRNADA